MALAGQIARYDNLRLLDYSSITSSYVGVGSSFSHPVRQLHIDNFTDQNLLVSFNGVDDKTVVHSQATKIIDIGTNRIDPVGQLEQPIGDRVYVKREAFAPTFGVVYVTVIYASTE